MHSPKALGAIEMRAPMCSEMTGSSTVAVVMVCEIRSSRRPTHCSATALLSSVAVLASTSASFCFSKRRVAPKARIVEMPCRVSEN